MRQADIIGSLHKTSEQVLGNTGRSAPVACNRKAMPMANREQQQAARPLHHDLARDNRSAETQHRRETLPRQAEARPPFGMEQHGNRSKCSHRDILDDDRPRTGIQQCRRNPKDASDDAAADLVHGHSTEVESTAAAGNQCFGECSQWQQRNQPKDKQGQAAIRIEPSDVRCGQDC